MGLSPTQTERCKNFFALGMMYWLYDRSMESTLRWIENKFKKTPVFVEANTKALHAGNAYAETAEIFGHHYRVRKAPIKPGIYRNITGNEATALGLVAASQQSGLRALVRLLPDHAGLRRPARALEAQELRREDLSGRGRDRGDRLARSARPSRAARHHRHVGSRRRAQERGDRPGRHDRASARDLERPARRPVDGPADQDRAGRPAAGALRPQRRVPGARRRGGHSRRLLLDGLRGLPPRGQVHDAGVPAHRRLSRQRLRAVGGPGRREAAEFRDDAVAAAGGLQALQARREDVGAPVGRSRRRRATSTASAASRSRT